MICRRLLESQVRNQKAIVKHAIRASSILQFYIQGHDKKSMNQLVADKTLNLARTQLIESVSQYREEQTTRTVSVDAYPLSSTTTSDSSLSRRPNPVRSPSPPPPPPSSFHPPPPFSTRNASHSEPRIATGMTSTGKWEYGQPGRSWNTEIDPTDQGSRPVPMNMNSDNGNRSLGVLNRSTGRESRVKDEKGDVVWKQTQHDNS